MIKNLKLRLNLDVEADRRVYEYLQNSERSISKEAIRSINEYLDLVEERKTENSFLDRVTATIEDSLKALTPLLNLLTLTQPVAQPQQAVPVSEEKDSAAEENMLEFLEGFWTTLLLSQDSRKSGKMSPLLLYGTKADISGDICRKIDSIFVTEIFECIKTAIYKE